MGNYTCVFSHDCASCPLHALFIPIIGQIQPATRWCILQAFCPTVKSVVESVVPQSTTIPVVAIPRDPLLRLSQVGMRLSRGAVSMTLRVALAPVKDLLTQFPRAPIWSARPASGDTCLPDLAYLPQECITQVMCSALLPRIFSVVWRHMHYQ